MILDETKPKPLSRPARGILAVSALALLLVFPTWAERAPAGEPETSTARTAGPVTANADGSFNTTITLKVENLGNLALSQVRVLDDLATTFPSPATCQVTAGPVAGGTLTANAAAPMSTEPTGTRRALSLTSICGASPRAARMNSTRELT